MTRKTHIKIRNPVFIIAFGVFSLILLLMVLIVFCDGSIFNSINIPAILIFILVTLLFLFLSIHFLLSFLNIYFEIADSYLCYRRFKKKKIIPKDKIFSIVTFVAGRKDFFDTRYKVDCATYLVVFEKTNTQSDAITFEEVYRKKTYESDTIIFYEMDSYRILDCLNSFGYSYEKIYNTK